MKSRIPSFIASVLLGIGCITVSVTTAVPAQAATYNVTSAYAVEQKFVGVTITRLTNIYKYQTNAKDVTRSDSCNGTVTNYNVAVAICC